MFQICSAYRDPLSFPTRRSSDLGSLGHRTVLYSVNWDGTGLSAVVNHGLFRAQMSHDGKKIYYLSGGQIRMLRLSNKKVETIHFSSKIRMEHREQREQIC